MGLKIQITCLGNARKRSGPGSVGGGGPKGIGGSATLRGARGFGRGAPGGTGAMSSGIGGGIGSGRTLTLLMSLMVVHGRVVTPLAYPQAMDRAEAQLEKAAREHTTCYSHWGGSFAPPHFSFMPRVAEVGPGLTSTASTGTKPCDRHLTSPC